MSLNWQGSDERRINVARAMYEMDRQPLDYEEERMVVPWLVRFIPAALASLAIWGLLALAFTVWVKWIDGGMPLW